jgi:hypothetical protein
MRLSEALILRADLQKRFSQIGQRLQQNARVQEGDRATEDPEVLLEEMERIAGELTGFIQRINRTNSQTNFEEGMTLSDALAERDVLKMRQSIYRDLVRAASFSVMRISRSEVKYISTVDVAEIQGRSDDLAKEIRELDTRIQEKNWSINLLD